MDRPCGWPIYFCTANLSEEFQRSPFPFSATIYLYDAEEEVKASATQTYEPRINDSANHPGEHGGRCMSGSEMNRFYEGARAYAEFLENDVLPQAVGTAREESVRLAIHVNRSERKSLHEMLHEPLFSSNDDDDDALF